MPSDERERDVDSYREYVSRAASEQPCEVFLNRYIEHAAIIVEFLFRSANDRVEILSGKLNPVIYGDTGVVRAAIDFLDRVAGRSEPGLYILIEDEIDDKSHPLLARARESKFLAHIELRRVRENVKSTYSCHFAVADEKHYRYKKSRGLPEAVVQFHATEAGATLHSIFQQIRDRSDIIPLVS